MDKQQTTSKVEIRDTEENIQIPKKKTLYIDGVECGSITPSVYGDELNWHTSINMGEVLETIPLAQGHGSTPVEAIKNAMDSYQKQIDNSIKALADIKSKLGLKDNNQSDSEGK